MKWIKRVLKWFVTPMPIPPYEVHQPSLAWRPPLDQGAADRQIQEWARSLPPFTAAHLKATGMFNTSAESLGVSEPEQ